MFKLCLNVLNSHLKGNTEITAAVWTTGLEGDSNVPVIFPASGLTIIIDDQGGRFFSGSSYPWFLPRRALWNVPRLSQMCPQRPPPPAHSPAAFFRLSRLIRVS